jgi:hypothetical protein
MGMYRVTRVILSSSWSAPLEHLVQLVAALGLELLEHSDELTAH